MREGFSTGTCAAAAAKAAALLLAPGRPLVAPCSAAAGSPAEPAAAPVVAIMLPAGERVELPVAWAELLDDAHARAAVVKDAGDDPDVTNGMTVVADVELGGEGVRFSAGEGVGVVTREGLQLDVGEPAINPVPREMIASALRDVLGEDVGALVTVSVPGGEEVATRTFNPRLGIEGGISIIGTSGRVAPKSAEAWMRSLLPQVDVVVAAGHRVIWLAPGGIGEEFAVRELGAPASAIVQCSNFVGELLDRCGEAGIERVVLVGHAGKLVKIAAGVFNTHSRHGDARLETVAALAAAEGASGALVARLLEVTTVQAAIAELAAAGLERTWDAIAQRAAARAAERAATAVDVVLLGYGGELLGATLPDLARNASADVAAPRPLAVVGVGPGAEEHVTPEAWREIRAAEVCAGGARLLDAFAPAGAERITIGADVGSALALVRAAREAGKRVAVLASGDPGLFGILATVRRELPDAPLRVVPGISSVQLAAARLGVSWDSVAIASAHGRDPQDALATAVAHAATLVLTGSDTRPQELARRLASLGEFEITVCERLGYTDERVVCAPAAQVALKDFDALSVVYVRNLGFSAASQAAAQPAPTAEAMRKDG